LRGAGNRRRGPGGARTKLGGVVEAGVVVGCSGPGETPGAEAEPVRESWRPEVRRGGVLTAAQIVGPAEQGVAQRAGVWGRRREWMGCEGVPWAPFCRAAANLGVRARDGWPA
jgi:hypothetical protein